MFKKTTMKKCVFLFVAVLVMSFGIQWTEITIGAGIPMAEHKMKDISGEEKSLHDIKTKKGLLVVFYCNTCPYVKLSESRIVEVSELARTGGLGAVLVNSNEEERETLDSFDEMKKHAIRVGYKVAYVVDKNSEMANAFGANKTPQCFLFDAQGKLVYKGALDDNVKDPSLVKQHYLKNAVQAVLKGEKPTVAETKSIGCTIKRKE